MSLQTTRYILFRAAAEPRRSIIRFTALGSTSSAHDAFELRKVLLHRREGLDRLQSKVNDATHGLGRSDANGVGWSCAGPGNGDQQWECQEGHEPTQAHFDVHGIARMPQEYCFDNARIVEHTEVGVSQSLAWSRSDYRQFSLRETRTRIEMRTAEKISTPLESDGRF